MSKKSLQPCSSRLTTLLLKHRSQAAYSDRTDSRGLPVDLQHSRCMQLILQSWHNSSHAAQHHQCSTIYTCKRDTLTAAYSHCLKRQAPLIASIACMAENTCNIAQFPDFCWPCGLLVPAYAARGCIGTVAETRLQVSSCASTCSTVLHDGDLACTL